MEDNTPVFNLKVVIKETGLKADTLRVWERRYGLPDPNRTAGGHRLYSERDIAIINWLQARKEEGLSIGRAAAMWKRIESEGGDPLESESVENDTSYDFPSLPPAGDMVCDFRKDWINACLDFDEIQSERVISRAFAVLPPEIVVQKVLQEGIIEIGEGWYGGRVTVQQEHFASALVIRRLDVLMMAAPPPTRSGSVLVACSPGEDHSIGPLVFTWLLRRRGWNTLFLGADVPVDRFKPTLEFVKPKLAALSAQQLSTVGALKDLAGMVVEAGIPLVYGGLIFKQAPTLDRWIPGRYLDGELVDAVTLLEQILAGLRPANIGQPILMPEFDATCLLMHLEMQINQVKGIIFHRARALFEQYPSLTTVHEILNRSVVSVIKIGKIDFLKIDIDWARGFLRNLNVPDYCLDQYMDAFHQAISSTLGRHGQPLTSWFEGRS